MSNLLVTLAQATQPAAQQQKPFWIALFQSPIGLMLILLVVFYVFMIRSKRNQEKQRQDLLNSVKKGDRVQTIGGILGSVVDVREDEVVVKVDETQNTKIRFARSAIHRVESEKPQSKA